MVVGRLWSVVLPGKHHRRDPVDQGRTNQGGGLLANHASSEIDQKHAAGVDEIGQIEGGLGLAKDAPSNVRGTEAIEFGAHGRDHVHQQTCVQFEIGVERITPPIAQVLIATLKQASLSDQAHLRAGEQWVHIQQGILQGTITTKRIFVVTRRQPGTTLTHTLWWMHLTDQRL